MKALRIFSFLLIAVLVFSCKPQVPDKYLQPDEFEDMTQSYTIGAAVGGTIGGIIVIAAIALIIRAVVKKKKAKRETP